MRKVMFKIVSFLVAAAFLFNNTCYGLGVIPASERPEVKRDVYRMLLGRAVRYAESAEAKGLLRLNNARCLLLSSGKYLVEKSMAEDPIELFRAMTHEDIEALMQIIEKENYAQYQTIRELILDNFPPDDTVELPRDLYVNDLVARSFELLILINRGMLYEHDLAPGELEFVKQAAPIVAANKSHFTAEFWNEKIRRERIKGAVAGGMRFYRAGMSDDGVSGNEADKEGFNARCIKLEERLVELREAGKISLANINMKGFEEEFVDISSESSVYQELRDVLKIDKGYHDKLVKFKYDLERRKEDDPEKLSELKTGQPAEPDITWDRLLYYLATGTIRLALVDDETALGQDGRSLVLSYAYKFESEDKNTKTKKIETRYMYEGEYDDAIGKLETKEEKKKFDEQHRPFYIIHVSKSYWAGLSGDYAKKACVIVREWTKHFMPSFGTLSPDEHADKQEEYFMGIKSGRPKSDLYSEVFNSDFYKLVKKTAQLDINKDNQADKEAKIERLYEFLASYRIFNDPTSEIKEMLYEGLNEFGIADLTTAIETDRHLLAFYRYLFDNIEPVKKLFLNEEFIKRLNVSQKRWVQSILKNKAIDYSERVRSISIILESCQHRNEVIRRNLREEISVCLFNYTDPTQPDQTIYMPVSIARFIDESEFTQKKLVPKAQGEMKIIDRDRLGLMVQRDVFRKERASDEDELVAMQTMQKKMSRQNQDTGFIDARIRELQSNIGSYNEQMKDMNKQIDDMGKHFCRLFNGDMLREIAAKLGRKIENSKSKRCIIAAVYGPTSAGKTTFAAQLMERLQYAGYNANILGSDSYLHPGESLRYKTITEGERFTFLRGQGIYNLNKLYEDINDIRNKKEVLVPTDEHDPDYDPAKPTRTIPGNLDAIIVDLTVLGLNKQIAGELDFIIPITFTTEAIRHNRRLERDTRLREESFVSERGLTREYVINEFTEKQFEELYDNMGPLLQIGFPKAQLLIWRHDELESMLFERRHVTKKALGTDALTPREKEYIDKQIADGRQEEVHLAENEAFLKIFASRAPPLAELAQKISEGKVKVISVDIGPHVGFKRYLGAVKADKLVYAVPELDKEGNGVIYITKVMEVLCLPYKDLKMPGELGLHKLAQLIGHEYAENKFHQEEPATAHHRAAKLEIELATEGAKVKGVPDIDLFILDLAAHTVAIDYLERLALATRDYDEALDEEGYFKKAVVEALAKAYFLNLSRKKVEGLTGDASKEKAGAAKSALSMIDKAIESSLKKAVIFKRQDIRATAYEPEPGKQEALCYEVFYRLGLTTAKIYKEHLRKDNLTIVVGKDVRVHSKRLQGAYIDGLRGAGVRVLDIGNTDGWGYNTTPMVSTAVYRENVIGEKVDGAAQITASHNDFTYNGIKLILGKENIPENLLKRIIVEAADTENLKLSSEIGSYERKDFTTPYIQEVVDFIESRFGGSERPLTGRKYAVLGVSGTSGFFSTILRRCGAEVAEVHCEPNGYFPYGVPDPDKGYTKEGLIAAMERDGTIEAGVAFDSDGDRLFFAAREPGGGVRNISNHELECMFADKIGGKIVVNSKTTMAVQDVNPEVTKWTSGYSFIKARCRELEAKCGLEESGHFMFGPPEYEYIDDGMKSAAMVFLLTAQDGRNLVEIVDGYPFKDYLSIFTIQPELKVDNKACAEVRDEFSKEEALYFGNMEGCTVEMDDGLRVIFDKDVWGFTGWFQFRQALATPQKMYLDFEAKQFNPARGEYEPSPDGVFQMMKMLRERMSHYETLKEATEALSTKEIIKHIEKGKDEIKGEDIKTLEYLKALAERDKEKIGTIPFNSPEVRAAIKFLEENKPGAIAELVQIAKSGLIITEEARGPPAAGEGYLRLRKAEGKIDGLPEQYHSLPVTRAADIIMLMGGDREAFLKQSRTRPEKPMILSIVLPDWSDTTHCGSLLATPLGYRLACDMALRKYGKDLNFLYEEEQIAIGGFSDAGTGKRCSPVSQAHSDSRGDMHLVGTLTTPSGEEVDLTLLLATAIQSSKYARANYGKTIDVHYASQIAVSKQEPAFRSSYDEFKKKYTGYDVLIVSVTDKRQAKNQEEAFEKVFGNFETTDVGRFDATTPEGKLADRFFAKYVAPAMAAQLTDRNLEDLGIYVIESETGDVIANYPKGILAVHIDEEGSKYIKIKEGNKPLAECNTLTRFDREGKKLKGPDLAYSYGSHRISRGYLLALEKFFGDGLDNRVDPGKERPALEAPDVAQPILLSLAGVSEEEIIDLKKKPEELIKKILKLAETNKITKGWMGAHLLAEGDVYWWRYRRPLDILNNQLMMLARVAKKKLELVIDTEKGLVFIDEPSTGELEGEAAAMMEFRGLEVPIANCTLGDVEIDGYGGYTENGQKKSTKDLDLAGGMTVSDVYIKGSIIQGGKIEAGSRIEESVVNKTKGHLVAEHSYVDSSIVGSLVANRALVMNVSEPSTLEVYETSVVDAYSANMKDGIFFNRKQTRMWADFDVDGKQSANEMLPGNTYTFTGLFDTIAMPAEDAGLRQELLEESTLKLMKSDYAKEVTDRYEIRESERIAGSQSLKSYILVDKVTGSSVEVVPGRGANVVGMKAKIDGQEIDVFYQPEDIEKSGGIPVLWPFANRIEKGEFTWKGRVHKLSGVEGAKNDEHGHTYHGMVRAEAWKLKAVGIDTEGVFLRCQIDTEDFPAIEEHFGRAKVTIIHRLKGNKLTIDVTVKNKGKDEMPMSLALHPWFKTPFGSEGSRRQLEVTLPASKHWEANPELIPTGKLEDAQGKHDHRTPTKLDREPDEGDMYDDVYTGLETDEEGISTSTIHDDKNMVDMEVRASEGFKHMVLYVPAGKEAVCIEPQTSATDSFNLARRGVEEATPVVLEPGDAFGGRVEIEVKKSEKDKDKTGETVAEHRPKAGTSEERLPASLQRDIDEITALRVDNIHTELKEGRTYIMRYDKTRLSELQQRIIEEYAELLRRKTRATIKTKPFSTARGSRKAYLIEVECKGTNFEGGLGCIDVQIPGDGSIEEYLLRITGMVNIALAVSNIPSSASEQEINQFYAPILGFVRNQYTLLTDREFEKLNRESLTDIIRKGFAIIIPLAQKIDPKDIDRFNRLIRQALVSV